MCVVHTEVDRATHSVIVTWNGTTAHWRVIKSWNGFWKQREEQLVVFSVYMECVCSHSTPKKILNLNVVCIGSLYNATLNFIQSGKWPDFWFSTISDCVTSETCFSADTERIPRLPTLAHPYQKLPQPHPRPHYVPWWFTNRMWDGSWSSRRSRRQLGWMKCIPPAW